MMLEFHNNIKGDEFVNSMNYLTLRALTSFVDVVKTYLVIPGPKTASC